MKNIKEIIGERSTSGLSSNLISPEESKQLNPGQPGVHSVLDREKLGEEIAGLENIVVTQSGVQSHSNTVTANRKGSAIAANGNPYLRRGFKGVGRKASTKKGSTKKGGNSLADSIAKRTGQ